MGGITAERWETCFFFFNAPRKCSQKTYWKLIVAIDPTIQQWKGLNVYYKRSTWAFSMTSAHLSIGKPFRCPPACSTAPQILFWNKKLDDVMLVITDLLFLELCFDHFDLWGWGFLIGCELLYLIDPCEQCVQILEKGLRIYWYISQCQGRSCSLGEYGNKVLT